MQPAQLLAIRRVDDARRAKRHQTMRSQGLGQKRCHRSAVAVAAHDTTRKQNTRIIVVIGPDGIISHEMRPFRVLAAEPYAQLDSAVDRTMLRVGKDRQ